MLCDNCKENEANIKYTQIINGVKKELNLCEKCGKELGVVNMQFDMPINFSNFLGDFLSDFNEEAFLPDYGNKKELRCNICNSTLDDILSTGRFGCSNCYDIFADQIDEIIKKIQGSNIHVGRIGKAVEKNNIDEENKEEFANKENKDIPKLELLQQKLKKAIREERYEDAAKLRDEINDIKNEK